MTNKMTNKNATLIRTGEVILDYPRLLEPQSFEENGKAYYSATILIPKTDGETYNAMIGAFNEATSKNGSEIKDGSVRLPWIDGAKSDNPTYSDYWVLKAKCVKRPKVLNIHGEEITNPQEIYGGIVCRVYLDFYFYPFNNQKPLLDKKGNPIVGVAARLGNILKVGDSDILGYDPDYMNMDFSDLIQQRQGRCNEDALEG